MYNRLGEDNLAGLFISIVSFLKQRTYPGCSIDVTLTRRMYWMLYMVVNLGHSIQLHDAWQTAWPLTLEEKQILTSKIKHGLGSAYIQAAKLL